MFIPIISVSSPKSKEFEILHFIIPGKNNFFYSNRKKIIFMIMISGQFWKYFVNQSVNKFQFTLYLSKALYPNPKTNFFSENEITNAITN